MRRQIKPIDLKEFQALEECNPTSVKGEMRKLYVDINKKMKDQGWSGNKLVAWFNAKGLPLTIGQFRIYLWDLDREFGYIRSTGEYVIPKPLKRSNQKVVMQAEKTAAANTASETFHDIEPKHKLNELMAEMPGSLPEVEGWDDLVPVGKESITSSNTAQPEGKPKTFHHDPSPNKKDLF